MKTNANLKGTYRGYRRQRLQDDIAEQWRAVQLAAAILSASNPDVDEDDIDSLKDEKMNRVLDQAWKREAWEQEFDAEDLLDTQRSAVM